MSRVEHVLKRAISPLITESRKRRIKASFFDVPDTDASLHRLKQLGFRPQIAIDVGAYVGEWTRSFKQIFPPARVLMVEPQPHLAKNLETTSKALRGVEFRSALLGAQCRPLVPFHQAKTASSVLEESSKPSAPTRWLEMTTLDHLTAGTPYSAPEFIKLDVQGYELEVLNGSEQCLRSAEAVLLEVNLLRVYRNAPLFHETVHYMGQRGFQVYDLGSYYRRPLDGALWQVDVIFVRNVSPLIASPRWS